MYLRFASFVRDANARTTRGIFQSAFQILHERDDLWDDWRHAELRREFDWFNTRLAIPDRFWYRPWRRAERSSVCWFRASAAEHVGRARYAAWLLGELGLATQEHRARHLHGVIWHDRHQVVTLGR